MAFFLVLFSGHVATWRAMLSLCFCRMAYNASSMLCRIADNASSMLLLWLLLHGEQVDHSFLSPLRRVWK